MVRHEKGQHAGGSVPCFTQNRHVGRVSQTTKKRIKNVERKKEERNSVVYNRDYKIYRTKLFVGV